MFANGAAAVTDDELLGYANCQAWSSSILRSTTPVSEEWAASALMLQATAMATPLNDDWSPFKNDARYLRELERVRRAFGQEVPTELSPTHRYAHAVCMEHVKRVQEKLRAQ